MSKTVTPENMNPIYTFTANPLPAEATIKKTIIEDGEIKSFNGDGKLIHSLAYAEKNMKTFIDTLKYYVILAEEMDGVYRYLETDMHNTYAGMVGANQYELRTYCVQVWVLDGPFMPIQGMNKTQGMDKIPVPDPEVGHWETVCQTKNVPITLEHDGVVSSKAVIVPTNKGLNIRNLRLAGANHLEMGNKLEMRVLLDEIFNGTLYGQDFQ